MVIGFQDSPLFAGFINKQGEAGLADIPHNQGSDAGTVVVTECEKADISNGVIEAPCGDSVSNDFVDRIHQSTESGSKLYLP